MFCVCYNVFNKNMILHICVLGMTLKLHLVVRFRFWSPGECGVPLHCHYSQVHSDGGSTC